MQLNEAKFEILNYSLNNSLLLRELPFTSQYSCYNLPNGRTIDPAKTVRDLGLGVLLSNDCSWSSHIQQMAKTARTMTSWVLSVFRDRSRFLMLTLYKTMVRSKLEYYCPVWNPDKISDIEAIESIQRHYTRRISGCQNLDYWERLQSAETGSSLITETQRTIHLNPYMEDDEWTLSSERHQNAVQGKLPARHKGHRACI